MVVSSRRKIGSIGTGTAGIDIAPSDARRANRPRATNDGSATACCSDVTTETQTSRPAKRCCHSCAVADSIRVATAAITPTGSQASLRCSVGRPMASQKVCQDRSSIGAAAR